MNFLRIRQLGALLLVIFFLAFNIYQTFYVWVPVSRVPLPGQPDIPVVILSYFTNFTKLSQLWYDLIYVKFLQGSAVVIRYLLIPFFLLPTAYAAQILIHRKYPKTRNYVLLWSSWPFIIFTMVWIFYTGTINGIAQAEGWYWAKWPLDGGFIEVPGNFDVCTHINAGGVIVATALNFAFAQWFGLDRLFRGLAGIPAVGFWFERNLSNLCTLFDLHTSGAIAYAIEIIFETVEALHPEDYGTWTNLRGNTYADIFCTSFIPLMIMFFVYWLLVPHVVRTYD